MNPKVKREYNFDEFLKTFFPLENKEEENSTSSPYKTGINISQNALATINKSIRESLNSSTHKKRKVQTSN